MIDYHVILKAYFLIEMKTMYKGMVDTHQSRVKRGIKRVSSDAKKEKKKEPEFDIFTSC